MTDPMLAAASRHDIPLTGLSPNVQRWIDWMLGDHSDEGLAAQLHDDVVFESPVVFTPQRGKAVTLAYLMAAGETLGNDAFRYTRLFDSEDSCVLEFETEMEGKYVNGVDMIAWNEDGLITGFKVMVRPLQAVNAAHAAMGAMLEKMKSGAPGAAPR